jgi:membrane protease YdiL (CAAX protease family)
VRVILQNYLSDGYALVCVASLLFGAYHWWSGVGNISAALLIGGLLMLLYRRSGALWPAILGHYLTDIASFAL